MWAGEAVMHAPRAAFALAGEGAQQRKHTLSVCFLCCAARSSWGSDSTIAVFFEKRFFIDVTRKHVYAHPGRPPIHPTFAWSEHMSVYILYPMKGFEQHLPPVNFFVRSLARSFVRRDF